MSAGGHDHDLRAVGQRVRGAQAGAEADRDVAQPVELHAPVVDHVPPCAQPGHPGDPAHRPADVVAAVDQVNELHAALAEHGRALHPGRPGADHEHSAIGVGGRLKPLRMPAAAVLLAGRRVLGAAEVAAPDRARVAGVAADALAHLVVAALLDLAGQERVGDRRPGGPD